MKTSIVCSFKTITIPRILPSNIFISYELNGMRGKSPIYKADSPVLSIDFDVTLCIDSSTENNLKITISMCNKAGAKFRLGSGVFQIPSDVFLHGKKEESHTTLIDANCGQFSVYTTIAKGTVTDTSSDTLLDQNASFNQFISAAEEYEELIKTMLPYPNSIHPPSSLWGEEGLFSMQKHFLSHEMNIDEINSIVEVGNQLPEKLTNSKKYTEIMETCFSLMMDRKPIYITKTGEKGTAEQLSGKKRMPLLAVSICKHITDNDSAEGRVNAEEVTSLIMLSMCKLISHKDANTEIVIYLLSTAIFVSQFIKKMFPGQFLSLNSMLENNIQSGSIKFLDYCSNKVSKIIDNPKAVFMFINSIKEDLFTATIPQIFEDYIVDFLLEMIDYSAVNNWIFNSDAETFDYSKLTIRFPKFKFYYIDSLLYIIKNGKKIVSKRKIPEEVIPNMRGQLLRYVLIRLNNMGAIKCSEKDLNKTVKSNYTPERPDSFVWACEHKNIEVDPKFSSELPPL